MIVRAYITPEAVETFFDFDFKVEGPYSVVAIIGDYLDYTFVYLQSTNKMYIGKFSSDESNLVF